MTLQVLILWITEVYELWGGKIYRNNCKEEKKRSFPINLSKNYRSGKTSQFCLKFQNISECQILFPFYEMERLQKKRWSMVSTGL